MKKLSVIALVVISTSALAFGFTQGFKDIRELLIGYEEVPSVSTTGNGEFNARINKAENEITYTLKYSDLEGSVQQAHIHLGQTGVNGGITVFLCSNLGNGPAGTQPCPAPPATISGTIAAADVSPNIPATQAARNQGLNTGEFDEFLAALRAGALYVNVHSTTWPGGEIRSQIEHGHGNDHRSKR
ncbi:MAG: CHRD domain-containing protein [Pyrinomonadaceae bacterium]